MEGPAPRTFTPGRDVDVRGTILFHFLSPNRMNWLVCIGAQEGWNIVMRISPKLDDNYRIRNVAGARLIPEMRIGLMALAHAVLTWESFS